MGTLESTRQSLPARLAELPSLSRDQLIELWVEHMGRPPPRAASTTLILRAVAYAMQAQEHSGLERQHLRLLLKIAKVANGIRVKCPQERETSAAGSAPSLDAPDAGLRSGPNAGKSHAAADNTPPESTYRFAIRPGTRLVREWQGRSHAVDVRADGYSWNGNVYRSLSAVALAITGARWSGARFFRL